MLYSYCFGFYSASFRCGIVYGVFGLTTRTVACYSPVSPFWAIRGLGTVQRHPSNHPVITFDIYQVMRGRRTRRRRRRSRTSCGSKSADEGRARSSMFSFLLYTHIC
ncbi:hypothetical protein VTJ04DRAFT_4950 [Mycothermus thermophilus]|uniref:uncharacterized protein n=1 Tax=Humicola insolens TaxID=85995 RepID=UPI00374431AA